MAKKTLARCRPFLWLAMLVLAAPVAAAEGGSVVETALHFFTRDDVAGILERLEAIRPAPISPAGRADVLSTLPPEGNVRDLDKGEKKKLTAARRVLEWHGRDTVYAIEVIDVPQAALALHGRVVLLVSRPALDLLDAGELQALVAHEVGHEYFWTDYLRARREADRPRLQTLELLCDGLAIVTLRSAGVGVDRLTSALDKVSHYNRERFGAAENEEDYPSIRERRRFARRLADWLAR